MYISEAFETYYAVMRREGLTDKTIRNYQCAANSFIECCEDIDVSMLSLAHFEHWHDWRKHRGTNNTTIAGDLSRFKQVLKHLKKRGLTVLDYDLISRPSVTRKIKPFLLEEEVKAIIDVIPNKRDKALFAMLFESAARISELLSLNRDSINHGEALITGKGDKQGTLYFSQWSMSYLEDYLSSRRDNLKPLFISSQMRRITVSTCERNLHIYSQTAGIETIVTPYTIRHSKATDARRKGADILSIKIMLRHERISSTEIYTHILNGEAKKIHEDFAIK